MLLIYNLANPSIFGQINKLILHLLMEHFKKLDCDCSLINSLTIDHSYSYVFIFNKCKKSKQKPTKRTQLIDIFILYLPLNFSLSKQLNYFGFLKFKYLGRY